MQSHYLPSSLSPLRSSGPTWNLSRLTVLPRLNASNSIAFVALLLFWQGGFALAAGGQTELRYEFRLPHRAAFVTDKGTGNAMVRATNPGWLRMRQEGSTNAVEFGDRVVVQIRLGISLATLVGDGPLKLARTVTPQLFILQAPDATTAAQEAARLAVLPGIMAAYPVFQGEAVLNGAYAPAPNDPHFVPLLGGTTGQWYLENRDQGTGSRLGVDVNIRGAWPFAQGEGVTVAIGDTGIQLTHPELADQVVGAPHHDFGNNTTNGAPHGVSSSWAHGTAVAGLVAAEANNHYGMAGVAPRARLAAWVIFNTNLILVSDEHLMDMYQFAAGSVDVENHSWGRNGITPSGPTPLERVGLANAMNEGRGGRGVVMVRAGGNNRANAVDVNDNAYASDPGAIAVASVTFEGRVVASSQAGACLLVAAPAAESNGDGLFSTDLTSTNGINQFSFLPPYEYLGDFAFNSLGFGGTSAAAPLVSGMAALVLSANPSLTYRDVQQILLLSARHFDLTDPGLRPNGAGLLVSHNVGFGVPDAAQAVRLARHWTNRPPLTAVTLTSTNTQEIPNDGLRVLVGGSGVPSTLVSIPCLPSLGPHADVPTPTLQLVDVGLATNDIAVDLTGKGALMQRGAVPFSDKITRAARAGAAFAVVYNSPTNTTGGGDQLLVMGTTDFVPIPAVFIGHSNGLSLIDLFKTNSAARAQIHLNATNYSFAVTNDLICEHVGVQVAMTHPLRGDVRITLLSPQGTRSVLQHYNSDTSAAPSEWTYWSTQHFFESSFGTWIVQVSDEGPTATGSVQAVSLILQGVEIVDSDHDGLDDRWEQAYFGSLRYGPADDPDGDGYNNAREQAMGTNPAEADEPLRLDLSMWNAQLARISWPGVDGKSYAVWSGSDVGNLAHVTNVSGVFPETEWFVPLTNATQQFFQIRPTPLLDVQHRRAGP